MRAIKTLALVDCIACEDTRRTGLLLTSLKTFYPSFFSHPKRPDFISYYDEVEQTKVPLIIEKLEFGLSVALVSDAGTPLISDPGYKLVAECRKRNIPIVPIPGPSSVLAALSVSGLSTNQFLFIGYVPKRKERRIKLFTDLHRFIDTSIYIKPTIVSFETALRLKESLQDLQDTFGDIEVTIERELSKMHEEVWIGKITEALKREFKGEIVLLFQLHPDVSS